MFIRLEVSCNVHGQVAKFVLRSGDRGGPGFASGNVDLAKHVGSDLVDTRCRVAVELTQKTKTKNKMFFGTLYLTITSRSK